MFSYHESMHLIVTHADILRTVSTIVNGIFEKDEFIGRRNPVEHDHIDESLVRGGMVVEWNLLFTTGNWSERLSRLITHTGEIFPIPYQHPVTSGISLIDLHRRFLDYLDRMVEASPDRIEPFLERIGNDPVLESLPPLLRKE